VGSISKVKIPGFSLIDSLHMLTHESSLFFEITYNNETKLFEIIFTQSITKGKAVLNLSKTKEDPIKTRLTFIDFAVDTSMTPLNIGELGGADVYMLCRVNTINTKRSVREVLMSFFVKEDSNDAK